MNDNIIQFNSSIAKGNDEVRIAFYANIGFYLEVVQMLEFNLRKLLCYYLSLKEIEQCPKLTKEAVIEICNKLDILYFKTYSDKWTLGQLIGEIEENGVLDGKTVKTFSEINQYRILIVHKLFQNNIVCHEFELAETVLQYSNQRLIPMTNQAIDYNQTVIEKIKSYKDKLHSIKDRFAILYEEQ